MDGAEEMNLLPLKPWVGVGGVWEMKLLLLELREAKPIALCWKSGVAWVTGNARGDKLSTQGTNNCFKL